MALGSNKFPDQEGIKTGQAVFPYRQGRSNKFPDQEGIKTMPAAQLRGAWPVPTNSLTKKGLRRRRLLASCALWGSNKFPDQEGIKTHILP